PSGPQLTVKNYLSWCSVSIDGGTASTADSQTVPVTPGRVQLAAQPASGTFRLGLWHHTAGDTTDAGEAGTVSGSTSTASVSVSDAGACVWVCCPFTNGTGCDVAEQCP